MPPVKELTAAQLNALTNPGKYRVGGQECGGLYVEVSKAGGKVFRLKYRIAGRENRYTIGPYPETSLKEARDKARKARALIELGQHPVEVKRAEAEEARQAAVLARENLFRTVAERYLKTKTKLAASTLAQYRRALENHVFPVIGDRPVADIKVSHINTIIERLSESTAMARYVLGITKAVLGYAEVLEFVPRNVASGKSGLLPAHTTKSHAAILDADDLGRLLIALDSYQGVNDSVGSALCLLALVACRPAEICALHWDDVNLDKAEWRYRLRKTKNRDGTPKLQYVPLARQSLDILRPLFEQSEGRGYVFPSPSDPAGHIHSDSLQSALINGLDYERGEVTAHGFRTTFRSIADEVLGIDSTVLELMIAHKMPGAMGDTYMRAALEVQRREAAQKWADHLDQLKLAAAERAGE
ncbi:putative prophage CPS-53 integrase [compost metagenome]